MPSDICRSYVQRGEMLAEATTIVHALGHPPGPGREGPERGRRHATRSAFRRVRLAHDPIAFRFGEEVCSGGLPAAELAVRLAEAYRLIGELTAQIERLSSRVEQLERQAGKDSSTSSRPPSSDSPYKKKGSDRSLRERGKRPPGKQPGEAGMTMSLVDDPDETIECPPAMCCGCGAGLAGEPVTAQRRHQVTDIEPAPAPKVTEYVAQAKQCAGCGTVTAGELPAHVRARASYGPETCAQAANLAVGHHIPIYRATLLLCQLAGIAVSTGWMAGIRGKAAALVETSGFMGRVRELLKAAAAVHADETPARAAGGTRYVHLACTRYLTCMHTGDRSADAINAGGVLPGYQGVIVRDGYAGYGHLTSALHAWCGVHLLRDLKGLYDFEPSQQEWASQMAALLIEARDAAAALPVSFPYRPSQALGLQHARGADLYPSRPGIHAPAHREGRQPWKEGYPESAATITPRRPRDTWEIGDRRQHGRPSFGS